MGTRATVTFHTSPEIKARLERLAVATRRSKSSLANDAVERYLAEEEALLEAAERGVNDPDASHVVSDDEAMRHLRAVNTDTSLPRPQTRR